MMLYSSLVDVRTSLIFSLRSSFASRHFGVVTIFLLVIFFCFYLPLFEVLFCWDNMTTFSYAQGSIHGQVIPKTKKEKYLMPCCLTLSIKVWIKAMWINLGKGVVSSLYTSL